MFSPSTPILFSLSSVQINRLFLLILQPRNLEFSSLFPSPWRSRVSRLFVASKAGISLEEIKNEVVDLVYHYGPTEVNFDGEIESGRDFFLHVDVYLRKLNSSSCCCLRCIQLGID